jgi:signal transduction histidine kinase
MNQSLESFSLVFLIYGLAFFSMGLAVLLEIGRGSGSHLRAALRPLAAFGILHGWHEWLEMFELLDRLPLQAQIGPLWLGLRFGLLAFSFLSLSAFGAALLSQEDWWRRVSLLVPLTLAALWGVGFLFLRGRYSPGQELIAVADAWTRYILGAPSALLASTGLIRQQFAFRRAGMVKFGQDSLWAAVGFAWYGAIGQVFVGESALPPSTVLNQQAFLDWLGIPIQLVRALAALVASVFVIRFLQAFEVEVQAQISQLRADQLREAERRQKLRGELLGRVVSAQEAERRRVARELHDDTGQALTAVGLGLRGVAQLVEEHPEKARQNIHQLEDLVGRALDELQRLIADLRPSHLDDLGLPATLRWYASELENRGVLKVKVEILGEAKHVDAAVNTTLFRVAQEALTNVVKHANVDRASLSLHYGEAVVTLEVRDRGIGFRPAGLDESNRSSWGLMGMEERASLLGGSFKIKSIPGQGTSIRVAIPYGSDKEVEYDDSAVAG